jgi:hypothetical protein
MWFTTCDPMTNAQRVDHWRARLLHAMPDLTEEDCLRQVSIGLGLRHAWNRRFERCEAHYLSRATA